MKKWIHHGGGVYELHPDSYPTEWEKYKQTGEGRHRSFTVKSKVKENEGLGKIIGQTGHAALVNIGDTKVFMELAKDYVGAYGRDFANFLPNWPKWVLQGVIEAAAEYLDPGQSRQTTLMSPSAWQHRQLNQYVNKALHKTPIPYDFATLPDFLNPVSAITSPLFTLGKQLEVGYNVLSNVGGMVSPSLMRRLGFEKDKEAGDSHGYYRPEGNYRSSEDLPRAVGRVAKKVATKGMQVLHPKVVYQTLKERGPTFVKTSATKIANKSMEMGKKVFSAASLRNVLSGVRSVRDRVYSDAHRASALFQMVYEHPVDSVSEAMKSLFVGGLYSLFGTVATTILGDSNTLQVYFAEAIDKLFGPPAQGAPNSRPRDGDLILKDQPSTKTFLQACRGSYGVSSGTSHTVEGFHVFMHSDNVKLYVSAQKFENDHHVCIMVQRGTIDFEGWTADLTKIGNNTLREHIRYRRTTSVMDEFRYKSVQKFGKMTWFGSGHSLGGALADIMLDEYRVERCITFNPAVQPKDYDSRKNLRVYVGNDPLSLIFGDRVTRNVVMLSNIEGGMGPVHRNAHGIAALEDKIGEMQKFGFSNDTRNLYGSIQGEDFTQGFLSEEMDEHPDLLGLDGSESFSEMYPVVESREEILERNKQHSQFYPSKTIDNEEEAKDVVMFDDTIEDNRSEASSGVGESLYSDVDANSEGDGGERLQRGMDVAAVTRHHSF